MPTKVFSVEVALNVLAVVVLLPRIVASMIGAEVQRHDSEPCAYSMKLAPLAQVL